MSVNEYRIWKTSQRAARTAWSIFLPVLDGLVLRPLRALLTIVVALILLFEEWGWQPLVLAFGRLARWRPVAALERMIVRLPPYGALAVFVLPSTLLLPVKLAALWLLAHGAPFAAGFMLVIAKLLGTGLVARIFLITKPQLMRIGWFAAAYSAFVPWKEAWFAWVRASWVWRWSRLMKQMARRWFQRRWGWLMGKQLT